MTSPPAASFIMFTYNQEAFVEEAAQSILSQRGPPLEILFSDDASTDGTFAILQRLAATYRGPHRVSAVQNDANMGVTSHVLSRCAQATGPVIILAAGDDLSEPDRARRVLCAFEDDTVLGCFSRVRLIGPEGQPLGGDADRPRFLAEPEVFAKITVSRHRVIQGCSAAYHRSLFPPNLPGGRKAYAEDILLSFLIHCRGGRIVKLDEPLVSYRQHARSLSNRALLDMLDPSAVAQEIGQLPAQMQLFDDIETLARKEGAEPVLDRPALEMARAFTRDKQAWAERGLATRAGSLLASLARRQRAEIRWKLLRLWGRHPDYGPMRLLRWLVATFARG